ncbi:hypothetical protein BDU57DRAFT_512106 [Ampelomyces quisqualis]|uniref:SGNH hydrolase-type esterase domain-containing protein n=1 Tax=Ampelomyces quisqualis TaxID=50730 RepID=A0A6A5QU07_AMPQU|nr:hypothetical protein BDU57DRAFT_512106 [Ampelomyces quisqualis]
MTFRACYIHCGRRFSLSLAMIIAADYVGCLPVPKSELRDGVHPNNAGDVRILDVWYPVVITAFAVGKAEKSAISLEDAGQREAMTSLA